jgi:2-polyprenyl-3-methyl-5-hydroxy-6-metoxy-1,4-benzoquinol methylase
MQVNELIRYIAAAHRAITTNCDYRSTQYRQISEDFGGISVYLLPILAGAAMFFLIGTPQTLRSWQQTDHKRSFGGSQVLMPQARKIAELYKDKNQTYFSVIRWEIISLIPTGDNKILEVGSGAGCTLRRLKALGKASEIVGIEINQKAAADSSDHLDGLFIGDVETMDLPYSDKYFDYILFADVLEHVVNPSDVLNKCKNWLSDDGFIIAIIPNIKHYSVLLGLVLFDEFKYTNYGLLDRSHLRFFTRKEIKRMFRDEQLEVAGLVAIQWQSRVERALHSSKIMSRLLGNNSFFARQYLIKAKKEISSKSTLIH